MNKISVIVPVYNGEKELSRCVTSIQNQTYSNLEIILVDDGSSDNSGLICDGFAAEDGRIKVIHQSNKGVAAARKRGFEMSSGGVLGFIDSDDYIEQNMYRKMMEDYENYDAQLVFCDYNSVEATKISNNKFAAHDLILDRKLALKYLAEDSLKSFMWNKIYKRSILKESDFYVGKLMEDFLCMPNILSRCNVIAYKKGGYYNYVRHDDSIMGSTDALYIFWQACVERFNWYIKNFPEVSAMCLNRVVCVGLTCFENGFMTAEQEKTIKSFFKHHFKDIIKNKQLNLHKKVKAIFYMK